MATAYTYDIEVSKDKIPFWKWMITMQWTLCVKMVLTLTIW